MRGVGARLQHEVHLHARRGLPRVDAASRHLHLLEHVEVVVARRRSERAHVGDRDAVHVPGVVGGRRPLGDVVRLLPRLGAADVDAIDDDAGHGLQHDPRITRAGNVLQLLVGDTGRDRLAIGLDDRRVAGDLNLFGHASHAERDAQRDDAAGAHGNRSIQVVREALERSLDLVGAGGQVEQVHLALRVRHGGLGLRPGGLDGHTGQYGARAVAHRDVDATREHLRGSGCGGAQDRSEHPRGAREPDAWRVLHLIGLQCARTPSTGPPREED